MTTVDSEARQSQAEEDVRHSLLIFDALIDGLRVDNSSINRKCSQALTHSGKAILTHLENTLQSIHDDSHRKRLRACITTIQAGGGVPDPRVTGLFQDAFQACLTTGDERLLGVARSAIRIAFAGTLNSLILEATRCQNRNPDRCVQILELASCLNESPSVERVCELLVLSSHDNARIKLLAKQIAGGSWAL